MANVRFYRLGSLPTYVNATHQGVFVHVTTGDTTYKSGLWFGGANGWEYLTNDTNAIDAAINAKIQELDVEGYAQATITINEPLGGENSSTLTISGIKEDNGIIAKDDTKKLEVAIDGKYNSTDNKIATESTVTNAIKGLKVENPIQAVTKTTDGVNTVLTFKGIKEADGVILQGDEQNPEKFTVGDAKLKIQIGSSTASDVFSANAQVDSTIELDGNVFTKNGDVISVITPTAVASDNKLVTEKDIANLNGAMHYRGAITSADSSNPENWPTTVAAGDVYIATGKFEKDGNIIESGDLIVFNSASLTDYKVIQSNITLGTGSGQIAKNVSDLTPNNMVIATDGGIKTIGISESDLTGTIDGNNTRTLSIANGNIQDGVFHHAVTITDTFKVIGKDFSKSINITSNNRSIEIANNGNIGVMVDLVWNTTIENNN